MLVVHETTVSASLCSAATLVKIRHLLSQFGPEVVAVRHRAC